VLNFLDQYVCALTIDESNNRIVNFIYYYRD